MTDRHTDTDFRDTAAAADNQSRPRSGGHESEPGYGYDDGLVHDHGWACRERGAPAY